MTTRRQWLTAAATSAALTAAGRMSWAQAYPSQPVRLLVGFAAGGNFDLVARTIGPWLSDHLRQPVIVDNRAGAGSNLATDVLVRATADGHTLMLAGAVNAINATLYEKLPFDFIRDVVPVAGVVRFPNVMAVNPEFPATTAAEFVAHVKAHPGAISQGSSGVGTTQHLAGELFKRMTGTAFAHVPYRGASLAITDLLGSHIQVVFEPLPALMPFIKSGRLRALGVTTTARSDALPDVPAIGEYAPGYEASGWNGVVAPRGTPASIVDTLNQTVNSGLADRAIAARFADMGAIAMPGSASEFARLIAAETDKWAKIIRAGGIKAV